MRERLHAPSRARPRPAGAAPAARTNSSGVWAPPPRGPSPSTVSAIVPAKWLASLAPPRGTPAIRRPRRSRGGADQRRGRGLGVHPGPPALHPRLERDPVELAPGPRRAPRRTPPAAARADRRSAPRPAGTTLNASPERITVGTALSCSAPAGSCSAATIWAVLGKRQQRVAAIVGGAARVRRAPGGEHLQRPAALRRTTTPSSPSGVRSPASKHRQAS